MAALNALSRLVESESETEMQIKPTRKANGGLLSRLQAQPDESSESEDGGDEAAIQRTMKRFNTSRIIDSSSDEDEDENGEDAYERMKRQLAAGRAGKDMVQKQVETTLPPATRVSSDEEENAPVRTNAARKFKPRQERIVSSPASPASTVRSRRSSPGLFVTPNASPVKKQTSNVDLGSDSDDSTNPTHNAGFNERVKRIRAERLAQKQQNEKENQAKLARREGAEDAESNSDGESGRRLTQQAKPTRKAGKKAMEAMIRDQQRIVRSMQLTHQSRTKKKYSTKDLFAKLGFPTGTEASALPTPDASSQPASPDAELDQTHDNAMDQEDSSMLDVNNTAIETPTATAASISHAPPKLNKGKGRALEFQHLPPNTQMKHPKPVMVQYVRTITEKPVSDEHSDSEDDLEIVESQSRFPVFDKIPEKKAQEPSSLLHLRHLAQLTSNDNRPHGKGSMNNMELQISLQRKAREQAQQAREEKLAELRAKGIHIETEEEREKRQAEVEDIVAQFEKAREHDLELAKREKELAKKNGETGDGLVSSDEDEDYIGSDEEDPDANEDVDMDGSVDEEELELSGSEEELDEEADAENAADKLHGMFDEMAGEDEQELETSNDPRQDDDMEEEEHSAPVRSRAIKRARNVVVDDDDDDEDEVVLAGSPTQEATQDDAMGAFGFGNALPAMGLTQAFAGTMASLAAGSQGNEPEPEQNSLDFLRSLPDTQPIADFGQSDLLVPDSQSQQDASQTGPAPKIDLGISQLFQGSPEFTATQLSEVPEPTQDAGFLLSRSPAGFTAMPSTIDTVMMPVEESPIKVRKGKLHHRRKEAPVELSDADDDMGSTSETEREALTRKTNAKDVFSVMKKAAKKQHKTDNFNKNTSWAKDIVEEQADESEDEYAGLGGASDDESGNEMDEELAEMIDTNDVKVNEGELAAYFNEQETKMDAARAAKLHQDIVSGALRKRTAHGNAFDMSDSEDEHEMRRRKAQKERQRMSRALLADERIGKLAQNAKQAAFLNTMIDAYDDSEYAFLNEPEQPAKESQSQSQEEPRTDEVDGDVVVPNSQASDAVNALKRKSPSLESDEKENRAPANERRTAAYMSNYPHKKARTLPEIKHQLSELLEDANIIVPDSQYISDGDDEDSMPTPAPKAVVVDRLTLSRTSTSSTTTSDVSVSVGRSMAFGTSASIGGFRVPSLVRRATSNISTVSERSASNSGASTPSTESVRRGGTGKSNIHAQAREAERRAVLEKAEAKRKESLKKRVGRARGATSVLGSLGGGFD